MRSRGSAASAPSTPGVGATSTSASSRREVNSDRPWCGGKGVHVCEQVGGLGWVGLIWGGLGDETHLSSAAWCAVWGPHNGAGAGRREAGLLPGG